MISTEPRAGATIVRLDRSVRHNALVPEMVERLVEHLRRAGDLHQPVVLTAAGSTFCPGADLHWLAASADPAVAVAELVAVHHLAIATLLDMPVPVIAAINGPVAGGGLGLTLASDYRLAAHTATFTAAYLRLGLTPDGGTSAFLPQMVGRARTLELLTTNRTIDAREAREWGLVHEVVADEDVLERAVAFARGLLPVPGYALRETRSLLDTANIRNQLQLESVAVRTAARGEFFRAALRAYTAAHPG